MMDSFQSGIISLVKSALSGEKEQIPADLNWQAVKECAKNHQIYAMIYYGVVNSGAEPPKDVRDYLETVAFKSLALDRNQVFAAGEILKAFSENGIDHMPLKGTILKSMYPKSEFRTMSDADILIKPEQYDAIVPIMRKLGYEKTGESNHEYIWSKDGFLTIELHKRLIPSYNKDYYAYYGDGWQLAKVKEGTRYSMTDEDHFIYLFTHFSKHYRDGGIGIRHFVDLHIYLAAKPDLNFDYIEKELQKLQLGTFYQNVFRTMQTWFEGAPGDEQTDFITARTFANASYGTFDTRLIAAAVKKGKSSTSGKRARFKRIWRLFFPTHEELCNSFPCLTRFPFLIPLFWVVRWFRVLLFRRQNIKIRKNEMKVASVERTDTYQQELHFVGLDFNFKE